MQEASTTHVDSRVRYCLSVNSATAVAFRSRLLHALVDEDISVHLRRQDGR